MRYTAGEMVRSPSSPVAQPSGTPAETATERLLAAVNELAQNVRVLIDVVDQVREDLSWLTRNGVPHQPINVVVHRMPLLASGARDDSSLELSMAPWPVRDPTADTLSDEQVRAAVIDDVVQRLAEPLGQLAQEQLNSLLSVMDHAHREVLQAIRAPRTAPPQESVAPKASQRRTRQKSAPPPAAKAPTDPPAPRGQLF